MPGFRWEQVRTYLSGYGATISYSLGKGWQSSNSNVVLYQHSSSTISVVNNAQSRTLLTGDDTNGYASPDGSLTLTHTTGKYTLKNDKTGSVRVFYDFSGGSGADAGKLYEFTSERWIAAGKTGVRYYYDSGKLSHIITAQGQEQWIEFDYDTSDRITSITVKDSPTGDFLKGVEYEYGSGDYLSQVKHSWADSSLGETQVVVRYTQYRYHGNTSILGYLKGIYDHEAIQQVVSDSIENSTGITSPEVLRTESEETVVAGTAKVRDYASKWFTYYEGPDDNTVVGMGHWSAGNRNLTTEFNATDSIDQTGYVKTERVGSVGCSACGGGSSVTYKYYYLNIAGGSLKDNCVRKIIVEDMVDASNHGVARRVYGLNGSDRELRRAVMQNPYWSPKYWCNSVKLVEDYSSAPRKRYLKIEARPPSAHDVTDGDDLKLFLQPYDGSSWSNDESTLLGESASAGPTYLFSYNNDGRLLTSKVKRGHNDADAWFLESYVYGDGDPVPTDRVETAYMYPTKSSSQTSVVQSSYTYDFWDVNDTVLKKITTTYAAVATGENGPGQSAVTEQYFDKAGRLRWTKDAEGVVSYFSYNANTGALAYQLDDANVTLSGGSPVFSLPSHSADSDLVLRTEFGASDNGACPTRSASLPSPINVQSKTEFDELGRPSLFFDHADRRHAIVYQQSRTLVLPYLNSSGIPEGPVSVTAYNDSGMVSETYTISATYSSFSTDSPSWSPTSSSYGPIPTGFSSEPGRSAYTAWTVYHYNSHSEQVAVDTYHVIPSSGAGDFGDHYYRTGSLRDGLGRTAATIELIDGDENDAGVQIVFREHDFFGRSVSTKAWTESGFDLRVNGSSSDFVFTGVETTGLTKPLLNETYYDGADDSVPLKVGDGHVTSRVAYHTAAADKFTTTLYHRDFRGRVRGVENEANGSTSFGPYQIVDRDWMGRAIASGAYSSAPTWATATGGDGDTAYADSVATNRIGLSRIKYDTSGRVYRTEQCTIVSSTGAVHGIFRTNNYYNLRGELVATEDPHGVSTEYAYDGAGRQYQTRTVLQLKGADGGSSYYSSGVFQYRAPVPSSTLPSSDGGDGVIELSHTEFDSEGNVTKRHTFESNYDEADGLDLDGAAWVRSTTHAWYDDQGRVTAMADYGSGNGDSGDDVWAKSTAPDYGSEPTSSGDTDEYMLVSLYRYNDDTGRQETTTDPSGVVTKTYYDALGRRTYVAENYTNFTPPSTGVGGGTDNEQDRVTGWVYNGLGQVTSLTAYNASSSTADQVTTYTYADPYNGSLVTKTEYPDGDDSSDNVQVAYNLDGSVASRTDQRGVVIQYTYDNARRVTLEAVTTIPSGVDDTVRAIGRTYDSHGRVTSVTSYGSASVSTNVVNQIVYEYNSYGRLQYVHLEHDGAKETLTPTNEYVYDESKDGDNLFTDGLRQDKTYPAWTGSGGRIEFDYGEDSDPGSRTDRLNLPVSKKLLGGIRSGAPDPIVYYEFNGRGRLAKLWTTLIGASPNYLTLSYETASNEFGGYDCFGRIKSQKWTKGSSIDEFTYTYDFAGNRTSRSVDGTSGRDQAYTYDGLHRLNEYKEGDVVVNTTTSPDSVSISGTPGREQDWTLDQLGNWSQLVQKTGGSTEFTQTRAHNDANEVGTMAGSNFGAQPVHDAAGNMTTMPGTHVLGTGWRGTYDAWNRLVEVVKDDDSGLVQVNEYDGLHRRIQKDSPYLSTTTNYYYNEDWQCLVETTGTSTSETAEVAYLWHPTYIDALAARIRNTGGDEHFFTHDANYNVTASVVNGSDAVDERVAYTPYGQPLFLDASFAVRSTGGTPIKTSYIENEHLYTGRRTDPETGLQLNRNRYYHQQLGRWVSRDPIGYEGGSNNLYEYVGGDPTGKTDPDGRRFWTCTTAALCVPVAFGTCTALCAGDGYWDIRGESYSACMGKCLKASVTDAKAFSGTCLAALVGCIGTEGARFFNPPGPPPPTRYENVYFSKLEQCVRQGSMFP